jgi:glyoxylase-like metal-dependent hydrolase (beta-lactamase superfamily II)
VRRDHERDPLPVIPGRKEQVGGPDDAVVGDVVDPPDDRVCEDERRQAARERRGGQKQDGGDRDCKDDGVRIVDVGFGGSPEQIGVYVVETDDGLALFDCGPSSTLPGLESGLAAHGLALTDIRHLLLSHIHLDHAGAAGALVRRHPELTVWVSEIGAPHLIDPSRLERSARRLYGDAFDSLWGELVPVPEANVRVATGNVLGWESFPTRGHASHHISYFMNGTLLAGDAAGVRMPRAEYVLPVSPPPDIDVEAWHQTATAIRAREPERLALIHFGLHEDVAAHLDRLETELDRWAARVREGMDEHAFVEAARADAGDDADRYDRVAPFWQSWHGLHRYWEKRAAA